MHLSQGCNCLILPYLDCAQKIWHDHNDPKSKAVYFVTRRQEHLRPCGLHCSIDAFVGIHRNRALEKLGVAGEGLHVRARDVCEDDPAISLERLVRLSTKLVCGQVPHGYY